MGRNSVQLYDEIKARDYTGSTSLLRNFLASVRKQYKAARAAEVFSQASTPPIEISAEPPPKPQVKRRMSPTRASWLLVSRSEKLDEQQRKYVEQIRQSHPDLEMAYQLGHQFVMMLAEHRDKDLDAWLQTAEQSTLPEFRKMAKGVRLDYTAVHWMLVFSLEPLLAHVHSQVGSVSIFSSGMVSLLFRAQDSIL